MTSTLQRLSMSAVEKPNSMLDRLHSGVLPKSHANELVSHHSITGGARPHQSTDFNPKIHTQSVPTVFGIPSEIMMKTKQERAKEMSQEQNIMLQMIKDNGTITENY